MSDLDSPTIQLYNMMVVVNIFDRIFMEKIDLAASQANSLDTFHLYFKSYAVFV